MSLDSLYNFLSLEKKLDRIDFMGWCIITVLHIGHVLLLINHSFVHRSQNWCPHGPMGSTCLDSVQITHVDLHIKITNLTCF